MARPFGLLGQGGILRSLPGTAQGRGRCGIHVSGLGERAGGLIGESWISENFFTLRDAVEDLSDTEQEAFFVWCNYKSHDLSEEDADDLVRDFRDEYQGEYDDEEDFAYEIIEECYDLPEFAKTYFDYEKFARDLFMCDYWFDDGFVFRAA